MITKDDDDTHVNYSIPLGIKSRIPNYFYFAMAGELVSIFGPHILEKWTPTEYDDNGNEISGDPDVDGSYYDLNSGSGGWCAAFFATCKKFDMLWLRDYASTLEWYDWDKFHGEIEDEIVERFCKRDHFADPTNCYYLYLCEKQKGLNYA